MELPELNRNQIFNIAVVILAMLIAFNFIYKRQLKEIALLKEKIDMEIKNNIVLESIGKLEKKVNAYQNLLTRKDISSIISAISNMAKESDLKIVSIRPLPEGKYMDYIEFPFDLVMSAADYHALGKFISRLESDRDVYLVDTINIRPETQTQELKIDLTLSSIVFRD